MDLRTLLAFALIAGGQRRELMKYTIIFKGRQETELKQLADALETSQANIIRHSVALLGKIYQELDSPDKRLAIVSKNGKIFREFVVLF